MLQVTNQQQNAICSRGSSRFLAGAGTGKTTTLIEYAAQWPDKAILYLAFNKTVKLEAIRKFKERGISNVVVETIHSLAYGSIVKSGGYTLEKFPIKPLDLIDLLSINICVDKKENFAVALHILKLVSCFCNSEYDQVAKVDYLAYLKDAKAISLVSKHYDFIILQARKLLGLMLKKTIPISHDFYLKRFQLSKPILHYHIIMLDEAQDCSPVMLDILSNQENAIRILVGDSNQQIYRWRYAVNSLDKVDYPIFPLTQSFRFGPNIAHVANKVLSWKKTIGLPQPMIIEGCGKHNGEIKIKAVLGRKNISILVDAIQRLIINKSIKNLYFEGRFESYTISDEGSSLYDVLWLHLGKSSLIRDPLIRSMKNISDLEDFAESTGDNTLIQLIKIVLEYGRDLPEFINKIKMAQVADEHRLEADIIYSTIHRCKGLEYDEVFILDDFINEDVIDRAKQDNDPKTLQIIEEEINILYVAVTRAKLKLRLPVRLLYLHPESGNKQSQNGDGKVDFDKIDSNPHSSASSSNLSRSWNKHEDENLLYLIGANFSDETIAKRLNRPLEEVKSRKDVLRSLL